MIDAKKYVQPTKEEFIAGLRSMELAQGELEEVEETEEEMLVIYE